LGLVDDLDAIDPSASADELRLAIVEITAPTRSPA
jgi:hypothetical protein